MRLAGRFAFPQKCHDDRHERDRVPEPDDDPGRFHDQRNADHDDDEGKHDRP
jgi:hypothetical protein